MVNIIYMQARETHHNDKSYPSLLMSPSFLPPFYPVHIEACSDCPLMYISYLHILPAVKVSAVFIAIVDPAVLMALKVMVYLLSSLRSLRVCDLMEPSEMVTVIGPPASEHTLMVYLYIIAKLSMTPDTVQVMARVVAVGEVTWRLFTGPGAVTGGSVGMGPAVVGPAVVGPAIVGSVGVVMAVGGADEKTTQR